MGGYSGCSEGGGSLIDQRREPTFGKLMVSACKLRMRLDATNKELVQAMLKSFREHFELEAKKIERYERELANK